MDGSSPGSMGKDGAGDSLDKTPLIIPDPPTDGSGDNGKTIFYGIHSVSGSGESKVYTDRNEALRALKVNKKARFKAFSDLKDAIDFSKNGGGETVKNDCPNLPASPTPAPTENSNYKGPKSQDLVKFRKSIEKHDFTNVRKCVDENPRYLVSSGDTPQILQEGSRYNALHVAARANNAVIAKYICETVKSVEFMNKLYGGAQSNLADRGSIMLDLYLNTPDKAANETPLHFASKLGAVEVVKVLASYPQCDRGRKNKFGDTARDLVCSRASGLAAEAGIKKDILFALEGHYYVAVLRSPDKAVAPTIPAPFSTSSPPSLLSPDLSSPRRLTEQQMVVSGVAGPMTAADASTFRKKWKTPPRKLVLDAAAAASPVVTDPDKGLERVGRALATDFKVGWKEYWAFLGEFVNLSSPEGLHLLEAHLKSKVDANPRNGYVSPKPCQSPKPVFSPISDLCNNFKSLAINDDRRKVSPQCIDNSSTVFATRLASSLPRGLVPSLQEIDKYQYFLEGCSKDPRFSLEDLSTAHSRLAALIHSRLDCSLKDRSELIESVLSEPPSPLLQRSYDVLKCVLNSVLENSKGTRVILSCDCPLEAPNNRFLNPARQLNFLQNGLDDDDEDDSDDDDEFFTPPSSPPPPDDDDAYFEMASDSPVIYIEGGPGPSKVDFDVYRTLSHVLPDLNPARYPHVFFWSACIAKHVQPSPFDD